MKNYRKSVKPKIKFSVGGENLENLFFPKSEMPGESYFG